jgi:hypothetical protein
MPALPSKAFWRSLRRRLCAGLTLAAYLAAALGVPLPASGRPKDSHTPFPCQNHACGCVTAEQCWTSCCCFTPEQRWAWALAHHVQPPAYAERPQAQSWRTTRLRDRDAGKSESETRPCVCCNPSAEPSRRPVRSVVPSVPAPGPGRKTCCSTSHRGATVKKSSGPAVKGQQHPSGGKTRWLLGVASLKCSGQTTLWASTGTVLPVRPILPWRPDLRPVGWLADAGVGRFLLPAAPPDPPPRLSAVCA